MRSTVHSIGDLPEYFGRGPGFVIVRTGYRSSLFLSSCFADRFLGGRLTGCWLFRCWLASARLFGCWLASDWLFSCSLASNRLFGCGLLGGRLLSCRLTSSRLLGGRFGGAARSSFASRRRCRGPGGLAGGRFLGSSFLRSSRFSSWFHGSSSSGLGRSFCFLCGGFLHRFLRRLGSHRFCLHVFPEGLVRITFNPKKL